VALTQCMQLYAKAAICIGFAGRRARYWLRAGRRG
jgi:hypothetical protein